MVWHVRMSYLKPLYTDEYQSISPAMCINTHSPPVPLLLASPYKDTITPTTFKLSRLSGEVACTAQNSTAFWGCTANGFDIFVLSTLNSTSSSWILPGNDLSSTKPKRLKRGEGKKGTIGSRTNYCCRSKRL